MEQVLGEIRIAYSDPDINALLKSADPTGGVFTRHFNQSEEFFVKLPEPFTVPSFSIHHDVRLREPSDDYRTSFRALATELIERLPSVFAGLTHMFDPAETLRPCFFQVYRIGEQSYLYLMRLDLVFKPQSHQVVEKGSNDRSPVYQTRDLVIEADVIPLSSVVRTESKLEGFGIQQLISDTWIGETGRGYFVQGIWLDTELTKFFSKLFVPKGKRMYPYFPVTSKYRTITHAVVGLTDEARRRAVPFLHRVQRFLLPNLDEIQEVLKGHEFSEDLETFERIKGTVPAEWLAAWDDFKLDVYLNEQEMKEYELASSF